MCPGRFFRHHQSKGESSPSSESSGGSAKASPQSSRKQGPDHKWIPGEAFFNAMGHEFGDAQKIFSDVVQQFTNVLPGLFLTISIFN